MKCKANKSCYSKQQDTNTEAVKKKDGLTPNRPSVRDPNSDNDCFNDKTKILHVPEAKKKTSVFYCILQLKKEQLRIKLLPCEVPQGCPQAYDGPDKKDHEEEIWWAFLSLPKVARSQRASVLVALICRGFTEQPLNPELVLMPCLIAAQLWSTLGTVVRTRWAGRRCRFTPCIMGRGVGHKVYWVCRDATESHGHGAGETVNSVEPAPGKTKCLKVSRKNNI